MWIGYRDIADHVNNFNNIKLNLRDRLKMGSDIKY